MLAAVHFRLCGLNSKDQTISSKISMDLVTIEFAFKIALF